MNQRRVMWKISIRALLATQLVVAIALVPIYFERKRCELQKRAYETFASNTRMLLSKSNNEIDHVVNTRSDFMKTILGDDSFSNTSAIRNRHSVINKDMLLSLAHFRGLRILLLEYSDVSFPDENIFEQLQSLEVISMGGSSIHDEDLAKIAVVHDLRKLLLFETEIGDPGMERIGNLSNLTTLDLRSTRITDNGLRFVSRLKKLRELDLSETQITNEGVRVLTSMPELIRLKLDKTNVSGKGIENIGKFTKLQYLSLYGTNIEREDGLKLQNQLSTVEVHFDFE